MLQARRPRRSRGRTNPLNKDFYQNLKAQAWWQLRRRFEKTHRMVCGDGEDPHEELISLPSAPPLLRTLQKELSQPTASKGTRLRAALTSPTPSSWRTGRSAMDSTLRWTECNVGRNESHEHDIIRPPPGCRKTA